MKRLALVIAGLGLTVALTGTLALTGTAGTRNAARTSGHAKVAIRHQARGCHAWSFNGGSYRATITGKLARGGTITFVNYDVMPHKLIQKSGPAVHYIGHQAMRRIGASVKVTFTHAGTYRFTTKAGEDYPGMAMKTIGEDNVLHLTVTVS